MHWCTTVIRLFYVLEGIVQLHSLSGCSDPRRSAGRVGVVRLVAGAAYAPRGVAYSRRRRGVKRIWLSRICVRYRRDCVRLCFIPYPPVCSGRIVFLTDRLNPLRYSIELHRTNLFSRP